MGAICSPIPEKEGSFLGESATIKTCSLSFITMHNGCASRLSGGNIYLHRPLGQLCASISMLRGASVREKKSRQWEDSSEANRSTYVSLN